jgi:probable rRNA maturation factor
MTISITNRQKLFNVDLNRMRKSLKRLLKELHCEDREISLLLVNDDQIRAMNKKYFNRNCPTNVISFAMTEGDFGNINPQILGDVVISVETASHDALVGHINLMDELEFLLIHGVLHLLGYDHENTTAEKIKEMIKRERELFSLLGHYPLIR